MLDFARIQLRIRVMVEISEEEVKGPKRTKERTYDSGSLRDVVFTVIVACPSSAHFLVWFCHLARWFGSS
jgi:hypothetical protein